MAVAAHLEWSLPSYWLQKGRCGWDCSLHRVLGAGNRWETHAFLGWIAWSPTLPGTVAAAQPLLWTLESLHSWGPRKPHFLYRLGRACSCHLASPCSRTLLWFWSDRQGVPAFRAALTHQLPAALSASKLWALMSMGRRPKMGWGQIGVGLQLPLGMNSLGAMGAMGGRWMVVGGRQASGEKEVGASWSPTFKSGMTWSGSQVSSSPNGVRTYGAFPGPPMAYHGPISMHSLPSEAHKNPRLSQTSSDDRMTCLWVGTTHSRSPLCWELHSSGKPACRKELPILGSPESYTIAQ